ncbi:hypothetical protein QNI19_32590 [Cytophagaceae bacterium DM2B3-1]|uniref:DUF1093 domain-containing protein n=1 Tax=Xanthocytophaga flava TaxID=3048013 RepID=A0ABT7CYR9_9BACT|nr:hypothetical protein [Xanthocytophaga flavus]MDJ1473319.1 hypothetical protein [Xanthocytophaga flavus]MDJ1497724.1 hypothetical protein [Xanthocytophaga flavus]
MILIKSTYLTYTKYVIDYKKADKQHEVTLTVQAEKLRADSTGNEKNIAINDWIDVGVYHKDDQGKDKLIYLKKHKVNKKENTFVITVSEEPSKAGIDPLNKLIDRHAEDNVKSAEEKTAS